MIEPSFQNLAKAEQDLLNTEYLMESAHKTSRKKCMKLAIRMKFLNTEEPQKEEVEQETEEESNEETEQGVDKKKQIKNLILRSLVFKRHNKLQKTYYNQILNAKGVSGAWSLAEEFKEKFPDHALLEKAVNYAAQLNLDYGIKLHQQGEYASATFYL